MTPCHVYLIACVSSIFKNNGKNLQNPKIYLIFHKNLHLFFKNGDFVENILEKKLIFSFNFEIFCGSIGCATKFHVDEISFFLSICFRS